jgi:hypothetical protein
MKTLSKSDRPYNHLKAHPQEDEPSYTLHEALIPHCNSASEL